MCLVDFQGNLLCGVKLRTSDILMHLQIMQKQPGRDCHLPLPSARYGRICHCRRCAACRWRSGSRIRGFCQAARQESQYPTPEWACLSLELVTSIMAMPGGFNRCMLVELEPGGNSIEEATGGWKSSVPIAVARSLPHNSVGHPIPLRRAKCRTCLKSNKALAGVIWRYGMKECELCDSAEYVRTHACTVDRLRKTHTVSIISPKPQSKRLPTKFWRR